MSNIVCQVNMSNRLSTCRALCQVSIRRSVLTFRMKANGNPYGEVKSESGQGIDSDVRGYVLRQGVSETLKVIVSPWPTLCPATGSPRAYESAMFDMFDAMFCDEES